MPVLQAGDILSARVLHTGTDTASIGLVGHTAALLAGDRLAIEIDVEAGVRLEIVEPSGTVAYNARGGRASWQARINVGSDAQLRWNAAPFVVSDGSVVDRTLAANIAAGGSALIAERLILGRTGEQGGAIISRQHIVHDGRDLLVEELDLTRIVERSRPGMMGLSRVLGTVLLAGHRPELESEPGATVLHGAGALARFSAADAHEIEPAIDSVWRRWGDAIRL